MNTQIQVRMDDLAYTRIVESEDAPLTEGQLRVEVDHYSLTANNITYGVVGEKIGYWNFFPATNNDDSGWGIIPVWGFAKVTESTHAEVPVGEVLYGYFPMGSSLVLQPSKVAPERLLDGAPHRASLPPVYNSYRRVAAEPGYNPKTDEARSLLMPLYATSYCLYDFLIDNNWFGAEQIIIPSASSKTAIGLAYALSDDPNSPACVGLTSKTNESFVQQLGLYDSVETYDTLTSIDASKPSVIVDMSGSGSVLANLHKHLEDNMRFCSNVGLTHYDANQMEEGFIKERSAMFFAPSHIQKRTKEWGPGVFEQKSIEFWASAATRSQSWLNWNRVSGLKDAEAAFHNLRTGGLSPQEGLIIRP